MPLHDREGPEQVQGLPRCLRVVEASACLCGSAKLANRITGCFLATQNREKVGEVCGRPNPRTESKSMNCSRVAAES